MLGRDIDNGDGTGGLAIAKDRESQNLDVETATHGATPRKGRRERDAARRAPEIHNTCNNTARQQ